MAKNKGTSNELAPVRNVDDKLAARFDMSPHLVQLMLNEPFYAGVLRGVNFVKSDSIPTAGVLAKDGDVNLWWNPAFVAGLPPKHVIGLLMHEAMHLALEHTTTRRFDPHIIHNYAADLAINSDIPEDMLPEGGLVPGKQFNDLTEEQEASMSPEALARYQRLSSFIASLPSGESTEWYFARFMENEQIRKDVEEGGAGEGGPGVLDDHEGWGEMTDEEKELVKGKVRQAVEKAVKDCDSTGRWGSVSSDARARLRELISTEVDWRAILKRFCGVSRRGTRTTSWTRLNRKYAGLTAGVKRGYTSSIAVYIDQSGSVDDASLELAFGELRSLAKRTKFTTFHFDTSVDDASEAEWRSGKTPTAHRTRCGGTDFDCVTTHAAKNMHRFDGYIIITDGEAPKPKASRLKRGWLIIPGRKLNFVADNSDFVINMKHAKKSA